MRCAECDCFSEDAAGWVALLARHPERDDVPPNVVAFCPPCASREFKIAKKAADGYT
jgi:hypothetical protein